jgi:hypothetical protein
MAKLFCAKVSHNPYKEEMITEIPERAILIDGYEVGERLLEGILFTVYFNDSGVTGVKIENDSQRNYFESNLNSRKWYREVKNYVEEWILEGDEVSIPAWLEKKYFKNGINCAFIEP